MAYGQLLSSDDAAIAVGVYDLDQDGINDFVLVENSFTNQVITAKAVLGLTDGGYGPRNDLGLQLRSFAAIDLLGTGHRSYVAVATGWVTNPPTEVGLYLFDGWADGGMTSRMLYPDSLQGGLTVADYDGDGREDVLAPGRGTGQLLLYRNPGDGGLAPPEVVFSQPSTGHLYPLIYPLPPIDLDGDGISEIVFFLSDYSLMELGRGDGGYSVEWSYDLVGLASSGNLELEPGAELYDYFQDGVPDALILYNNSCWILDALPDGGSVSLPVEDGGRALACVGGDLNGDQIPDLMAVWQGADSGYLDVSLGQAGGFAPSTRVEANSRIWPMRVTDVDGDGTPDLVVVTRDGWGWIRGPCFGH